MGAAQSTSEITQSVLNRQLFESVSKTLNSVSTSNVVEQNISQRIDVKSASMTCYLGTNIVQTASMRVSALANLSATDMNQVTNEIMGNFKTKLEAESSQKNSGVQIGLANNSSKMTSTVENQMSSIIKNSLTTSRNLMLQIKGDVNQVIEYNPGKIWTLGRCNITNQSIIDTMSKTVTDSIVSNISSNKAVMDAMTEITSKSTQSNEGVSVGIILVVLAIAAFLGLKFMRLV